MSEVVQLTKKDFVTDQEVRWCPGCGDYAILASTQATFAELGIPKERFVVVSGIGCSSRFPYYMNTYGFHSIHGRAPAVATGIKLTNPELEVWMITGDGDGLSIGGNHLIHLVRRNLGIKVMLFDNRIYGLTKGQYSPTSETGKKTKSTPFGSVDRPFTPAALMLGAGATFVARSIDVHAPHLRETMMRAHQHTGTAFVHIFQNCNIFNDGAFEQMREKGLRDDNVLALKHGEPLVFGKNKDRGIRLKGLFQPEVVQLGNGVSEKDLIVHDERGAPGYATMLAEMKPPEFPMPIGVLHVADAPPFERAVHAQIDAITAQKGPGELKKALYSGGIWEVK
ncbi:MAG TPA: 2-oxoacid:ferredoxin oxidoreductase subunit beta [Candidatus Polarisedimenticolaceae bacterium]|nr:2-oxoacid:ferredoxin oxidoreductase subunit beta [Candidatus Polarisedimenticolaceae bacterium]